MTSTASDNTLRGVERFAKFPSQIWLLLGGSFFVRALGFAYPFLSYFVAERGHGPTVVSFVLAAFGAGWVLGQLVSGSLVDRIGGRMTLVAAMVTAAVVLCALSASHSTPMLVGGAVVFGLAFDAPRPIISAAIAELIPDSGQRARIDAFRYGWVVNAGGAITGALGGLLAIRIGVPALFLMHAAACAMFALCGAVVLASRCSEHCSVDRRLGLPAGVRRQTPCPGVPLERGDVDGDDRRVRRHADGDVAARPRSGRVRLGAGGECTGVVVMTPLLTPWLSRRIAVRPRLDILVAATCGPPCAWPPPPSRQRRHGFSLAGFGVALGETAWFVVAVGIVHRIAPPAATRSVPRHLGHSDAGRMDCCRRCWPRSALNTAVRHMVAATTVVVGVLGAALCLPLAHHLRDREPAPMSDKLER